MHILATTFGQQCDEPAQIDNGDYKLFHETDPEDIVIAHYTCHSGYKLRGDDEIYCVTQSTTWHGRPPKCEKSK